MAVLDPDLDLDPTTGGFGVFRFPNFFRLLFLVLLAPPLGDHFPPRTLRFPGVMISPWRIFRSFRILLEPWTFRRALVFLRPLRPPPGTGRSGILLLRIGRLGSKRMKVSRRVRPGPGLERLRRVVIGNRADPVPVADSTTTRAIPWLSWRRSFPRRFLVSLMFRVRPLQRFGFPMFRIHPACVGELFGLRIFLV
jgi:hypothetical protein